MVITYKGMCVAQGYVWYGNESLLLNSFDMKRESQVTLERRNIYYK